MMMTENLTVSYRIDAENRISWVSQEWWPFALANEGLKLRPEKVQGTNLLDYISDLPSRELYDALLRRIRTTGQSILLEIRCDSPELRRFLTLSISPLLDGSIALLSRTVRVEPRPAQPLLQANVGHGRELLQMCSWCKRVKVGQQWLEVEEAAPHLPLTGSGQWPDISHGICPPCKQRVSRQIDELSGEQ